MTDDYPDALHALREAGAEHFDPPAFGCVVALFQRAQALEGGARTRLLERAQARLDALAQALAKARGVAEQELAELLHEGVPVEPRLREALARGEVGSVRRALRRARWAWSRGRQRVEVPWAARLSGTAQARGSLLPDAMTRELGGMGSEVSREAHGRAVALGEVVSRSLLQASMEGTRAAIAVARATDNVPEASGPYNGQALAARALAAMADLSPAYVQAVVAVADDLAALDALLVDERTRSKAKTKAKRRRRTAR